MSMPRQPRFVLPGQPQHVIQRGNNRQNIFCAESDYLFFLEKLSDAAEKHQCDINKNNKDIPARLYSEPLFDPRNEYLRS
jgi:REP element-mobilizing transposase RayT